MNLPLDQNCPEVLAFIKGLENITLPYLAANYPRNVELLETRFEVHQGPRYLRIAKQEYVRATGEKTSGSVHCFLDRTNGDVLKAAGWKAPAKHARGNLGDAHAGLGSMGVYGPAYRR